MALILASRIRWKWSISHKRKIGLLQTGLLLFLFAGSNNTASIAGRLTASKAKQDTRNRTHETHNSLRILTGELSYKK